MRGKHCTDCTISSVLYCFNSFWDSETPGLWWLSESGLCKEWVRALKTAQSAEMQLWEDNQPRETHILCHKRDPPSHLSKHGHELWRIWFPSPGGDRWGWGVFVFLRPVWMVRGHKTKAAPPFPPRNTGLNCQGLSYLALWCTNLISLLWHPLIATGILQLPVQGISVFQPAWSDPQVNIARAGPVFSVSCISKASYLSKIHENGMLNNNFFFNWGKILRFQW